MALLAFLIAAFFLSPPAYAEWGRDARVNIYFDRGDPSNSVAILNDQFLEIGDMIDSYEVLNFEPDALVLKDVRDGSPLKLPAEGIIRSAMLRQGRYLFVVKQLHAIRDAQILYEKEFHEGYALDLETLMHHGFLKDGFENYTKQGYRFSIVKTGHTKPRFLRYQNLPTFFAIAEPLKIDQTDPFLYFSIDYLGEVRYAETKESVSWGPVWDYNNVFDLPIIRDITAKD